MIKLLEQEVEGKYKFNSQIVMTRNFQNTMGDQFGAVVIDTMRLIRKRVSDGIADYFQVADFDGAKFWIIDDVDHLTFLMPEDY